MDDKTPDPAPLVSGPVPDHVPLPADVIADRMEPDGGGVRHAARKILRTQPVIGPVEGNIPMPDAEMLIGYPWDRMAVGDSFHVSGTTGKILDKQSKKWASDRGVEFEFETHDQQGGVRIWRVA